MKKNMTVISLGGSLLVPDGIDRVFLKKFKAFIQKELRQGKRFAIISGGGSIAREYQENANRITKLVPADLDWLGIHATRLNAHLLRAVFYKEAHPVIVKNPTLPVRTNKKLIIAAGWKPGRSSDSVAVKLAHTLGAEQLINLTNTDGVYNKDPKKYKNAKRFRTLDWKTFRKLLPKKWDPGLSAPFDPIAAREAEQLELEVLILQGKKFEEFKKALRGKKFQGTTIK